MGELIFPIWAAGVVFTLVVVATPLVAKHFIIVLESKKYFGIFLIIIVTLAALVFWFVAFPSVFIIKMYSEYRDRKREKLELDVMAEYTDEMINAIRKHKQTRERKGCESYRNIGSQMEGWMQFNEIED